METENTNPNQEPVDPKPDPRPLENPQPLIKGNT